MQRVIGLSQGELCTSLCSREATCKKLENFEDGYFCVEVTPEEKC